MRLLLVPVVAVAALSADGWSETYSLRFSKSANRYTWTPRFPGWSFSAPVTLAAAGDTTAQIRMTASASMNSWLDTRGRIWQESAGIRTRVTYPILGPRASIGISAGMQSRKAGLKRQRTRNQSVGFSFEYRPLTESGGVFENLRFRVVPGVISARRASPVNPDSLLEETGLQYTGSLSTSPSFEVGGRKLSTTLSVNKTDNTLEINKSRSESVRMSAAYTLPGNVRTSLSLNESRRQYGVSRPVGEGARTSVAAELSENRSTGLSSSLSFKLFGFDVKGNQSWTEGSNTNTANAEDEAGNHFFARDRKNQKWNLGGTASGRLSEALVGNAKVRWSTTDERRLPVILSSGMVYRDPADDRQNRDMEIGGSLNWQLDEDHSVQLSASTSMHRHDNPGDRKQDRDLFNRALSLSLRGGRASGLRYNSTLSSNLVHHINLHASRAGGNERSHTLRLSFGTNYERMQMQVTHSFEISARRTIFDFDRELHPESVDRRSDIRRSWGMRHSVKRSLFSSLSLSTNYNYAAYDLGTLLVEGDSQIVEKESNDHTATFGMSYRPAEGVSMTMNYSMRLRRIWDVLYGRDGVERDLDIRNPHQTLRFSLNYSPAGATGLSFYSSRSRQRSGTFDSLSITLTRNF